jgi:hypothetical protein
MKLHHLSPLLAVLCLGCQGMRPAITIPEWHAVASVPQGTTQLETRVSPDGIRWSGPNFALDASGATIPANPSIAPGIGSDNRSYLLAFFDPAGSLRTMRSTNGLVWAGDVTHNAGTPFAVDDDSRPAVAHDFRNGRWVAAFRTRDNHVTVLPLPATGAGTPSTLTQATTAKAPALSWVNDEFVLAIHTPSGIRVLKSADGVSWPALAEPATVANSPIPSEGAPYITNSVGTLFMATTTPSDVVVHSSTDGRSWAREKTLARSATGRPDPAISGPLSEQVVALPNNGATTQIWINNPGTLDLATSALAPVSLANGPRDDTVLQQARIVFNTVQRVPAAQGREDVRLQVTWDGVGGRGTVRRFAPWDLQNVTRNQGHSWNEGRPSPDLPLYTPLIQAGEQVTIQVIAGGDTFSAAVPFASLAGLTSIDAMRAGTSDVYRLGISTTLANP